MDSGRRALNLRLQGLYSSRSISLYIIYVFTSLMAITMGWSCPNKVTRNTVSPAWGPCAMTKVTNRETPSGAVSVAVSAREGAAPLPAMT